MTLHNNGECRSEILLVCCIIKAIKLKGMCACAWHRGRSHRMCILSTEQLQGVGQKQNA